MENTPLEIYETAYRLHYIENRIAEASEYYKALIKEFPESNECGYAVIQLQKIKSNSISKILKKKNSSPLAVIACTLCSILIALIAFLAYSAYNWGLTESTKRSLITRALAEIHFGDSKRALELLAQAKNLDAKDFAAFEITAGIHKMNKNYIEARMEFEHFNLFNPGVLQPEKIIELKILEESQAHSLPSTVSQPFDEPVTTTAPESKRAPQSATTTVKPAVRKTATIKGQKKNNLYLINPDSISYF